MYHRLRAVAVTAGLGLALAALPAQGALADGLEATFPTQDAAIEISAEDVAKPSDENAPVSGVGIFDADVPLQSDEAPDGPAAETPTQSEAGTPTTPMAPPKTDGDGDVAAETSPITEADTTVSNSLSASTVLPLESEAASGPAQQPTPVKGWSGNHYWDGTLNDDGTERLYTGWVVDDHDGEGLQRYWVISGEKFTEGLFHVGDGTCGYALADEGWVLRGISDVIDGLVYIANNDGILLSPGWHVTGEFTGGNLQRYYIEDDHAAHVGYSESGGWAHYTTSHGYVARGKTVDADGTVALADNDGRVEKDGWLVTGAYDDGGLQRYYIEKGAAKLGEFTVGASKYFGLADEGYVLRGGGADEAKGRYADNDGVLAQSRWVVTDAFGQGLQRYWFDSSARMASGRLVDPTSALDAGAGWYAYARPEGYVVRGKYDTGRGLVYLANNDGVLASTSNGGGWLVTGAYDGGGLQRYWIDPVSHAARSGFFAVDGKTYFGLGNQGYVLRGKMTWGDHVLLASNDGDMAQAAGWLVTGLYDGGTLQRYWIGEIDGFAGFFGAVTGFFDLADGTSSYGVAGQGYVLRNAPIWRLNDDYTARYCVADNDGRLIVDEARSKVVSTYAKWMAEIALDDSHGYDQLYRLGQYGDYDCSALTIAALEKAGIDTAWAWSTRDMRAALTSTEFEWIPSLSDLQYGDILLAEGHHAAVYLGDGKLVEAWANEFNGAVGGKPGDQTGEEIRIRSYYDYPWSGILRLRA